jgi:RNA polymerase sigma-70 factor (ECF subfamily)
MPQDEVLLNRDGETKIGGQPCSMPQDDLLLAQLKEGDSGAYAVLVEQFEGPLYRFFFCDHRDHHLAQEQTAETFGQLVQSLRRMHADCDNLRAYVFGTARHIQLRRMRERTKTPSPLADAPDVSDPRPSPMSVASDREELERVLSAIRCLEDPLRNVLLLRFVEGCSIEEVAEALKIPVGTVKSHISRSRARLRQILLEKDDV